MCRNKRKILTAHAAGEGLPEVGQELVNLGKGLGVRRVVVEHQAARGHVESSGIHRVHRRRSLAAGCAVRRRSARAAGAGGPGAGAGRVSPWSGATWSRAAAPAAARRPRRPCQRGPRRLLLRLPRGRPRSERRLGPGGSGGGATAGPCGPYPPRRGAPAAVGASLSGGSAWRRPQAGSANGRGAAAGPRCPMRREGGGGTRGSPRPHHRGGGGASCAGPVGARTGPGGPRALRGGAVRSGRHCGAIAAARAAHARPQRGGGGAGAL